MLQSQKTEERDFPYLARWIPSTDDLTRQLIDISKPMRYVKRKNDCLIPNDDYWKLDGSKPEVEKSIAEGISGGHAFPDAWHFVYIIEKTE